MTAPQTPLGPGKVPAGGHGDASIVIPNPANPQSLNRYSYTLNNPLRYTDPSGHREVRYSEGEWIDERTIHSEYAGPFSTSFSEAEQMEVIESIPGFAAMPIVALVNPGYAGRGVVSTLGYVLGSLVTRQEIDTKGIQLVFYVGGVDNTNWWWGAASNNIQYLADRFTEGDIPTSGKEWLGMGNDMFWNGATGTAATGLQTVTEKGIGSLATWLGEGMEGFAKGVTPAIADAASQWIGSIVHNMSVTQTP